MAQARWVLEGMDVGTYNVLFIPPQTTTVCMYSDQDLLLYFLFAMQYIYMTKKGHKCVRVCACICANVHAFCM